MNRWISTLILNLFLMLCLFSPYNLIPHLPSLDAAESEMYLKDKFQAAEVGDYAVISHQKLMTLLRIVEKTQEHLIIEEVTIPASAQPKDKNWSNWLLHNAPGHTSWIHTEIFLSPVKIGKLYSLSRGEWLDGTDSGYFFSTLLTIPFSEIASEDRKRVGATPMPGEIDRRRIWQPTITINGTTIKDAQAQAYKGRWPKDGSEMAGKLIVLYLIDPHLKDAGLPYFPYWLEIVGKITKTHFRIIDSGKGLEELLTSPRQPSFSD